MKKKTVLVFSLILSVASLIYLISDYYGYIRYHKLHMTESDVYIKKYTSLGKPCKDRVVICFSVSIENISRIDPFLNSILDQSVRVDEIMLITAYPDLSKISEKYKKVCSVHGYNKNYDNNAGLICSVLTEPDANTKIIIVSPEIVYPPDFVQTLVAESEKYPDKIIYGSETKEVKYGVLVKPEFFDDEISKYQCGSSSTCSEYLDKYSNIGSTIAKSDGVYYRIK